MVLTDASDAGLGAVLMQANAEGERHPLVYLSKRLLPREQNYAATEKECLAMVWALKSCSRLYLGSPFLCILTTHP